MSQPEKAPAVIVDTIENLLEERKSKADRRKHPEVRLPKSVERRSGRDRRKDDE